MGNGVIRHSDSEAAERVFDRLANVVVWNYVNVQVELGICWALLG
jgi:hypothetical protein